MSWFRIDDGMLDHPKWKRAIRDGGDAALHLWLSLGTWCSRHLTDGLIPADMLSETGGPRGKKTRDRAWRALLDSSLLVRHIDGSVLVHDYLDYNPSRADVLAERDRRAQSKRVPRVGGELPSSRPDPVPIPSITPSEREPRAPDLIPPVPGLALVHPLPPSTRDQQLEAQAYTLTANGLPRYEFTPGWSPGKSNQARGHELGLTDEEIWARWETCKDRCFPTPFRSDVKQFNRELAFAAQDKTTNRFKNLPKSDRDAFEMPGRERRAT